MNCSSILLRCAAPIAFVLAGVTPAVASGPMESFVLVEKVTFEPNAEKPERVRVQGAFVVADGKHWRYLGARWGIAYFSIVEGSEDACRAEWKDLAKAAETREIVGFGEGRRRPPFAVSPLGTDDLGKPHPYPVAGVKRVRNVDYGPARTLSAFPRPISPVESIRSGRQRVEFVVRNIAVAREGTRYLFEVETSDGGRLASPAIEPGEDGKTSWKVHLTLKENDVLSWRVRVVQEGLDVAAVAVSRVKVLRDDR